MAVLLLGAQVVGQDQQFAEKLDGTGGGDTGGADEQLEGLLERFIRCNEVEDLAARMDANCSRLLLLG